MGEEIYGKDVRLLDDDIKFSNDQDFSIISGVDNLYQSIINRLLTIKGEYYNVEYGSELYKVNGETPDDILRNQMVGYIVDALNQEPRVESIESIEIEFERSGNDVTATIMIGLIGIDSDVELNLVFPYFITGQ